MSECERVCVPGSQLLSDIMGWGKWGGKPILLLASKEKINLNFKYIYLGVKIMSLSLLLKHQTDISL